MGPRDFDLEFKIGGVEYNTTALLYDVGADSLCGKGTWVFRAAVKGTDEVRVIKDCWIESGRGEHTENTISKEIQDATGSQAFLKHFINICGECQTDTSRGFQKLCKTLTDGTFKVALALADPSWMIHSKLPLPRFRLQVAYCEEGMSLFEVSSLEEVFRYLDQVMDGMCKIFST